MQQRVHQRIRQINSQWQYNVNYWAKESSWKKTLLQVIAYSQGEYWCTDTNKGYIMTYKVYGIAKDYDIAAQIFPRNRKYRKRTKRVQRKPLILEKTKFILGEEGHNLKKKVYFDEGRKRSQRENSLFGTILLTLLPLVGEIAKVFK